MPELIVVVALMIRCPKDDLECDSPWHHRKKDKLARARGRMEKLP